MFASMAEVSVSEHAQVKGLLLPRSLQQNATVAWHQWARQHALGPTLAVHVRRGDRGAGLGRAYFQEAVNTARQAEREDKGAARLQQQPPCPTAAAFFVTALLQCFRKFRGVLPVVLRVEGICIRHFHSPSYCWQPPGSCLCSDCRHLDGALRETGQTQSCRRQLKMDVGCVFFSDEPRKLRGWDLCRVFDAELRDDVALAVMAGCCCGAVLSASTFGWWAALLGGYQAGRRAEWAELAEVAAVLTQVVIAPQTDVPDCMPGAKKLECERDAVLGLLHAFVPLPSWLILESQELHFGGSAWLDSDKGDVPCGRKVALACLAVSTVLKVGGLVAVTSLRPARSFLGFEPLPCEDCWIGCNRFRRFGFDPQFLFQF